ncbi:hypothetical protein [Candidatus Methylobacter oryzae]|uniref:DUF4342 domain-containing protein n=1 Tax=Candidatus Methylobacter oryzae TaxID=2497749 RepID=A0ABY3CBW6_9GAMM|nr:hypothetical protein [Candidatus Methylobacter oryzae]TRW97000.1 hypothetical protein EKO24_008245 [Candidatus Methylobacter oryzae]
MSTLLCYNNFLSGYENISFQEKYILKKNNPKIQITITAVEKKSETSKVIIETMIPLPLAILLFVVLIPVILIALILAWPFSLVANGATEPSYTEAKEYFNNGQGYLNNLSEKDKKELLIKNQNIHLGL